MVISWELLSQCAPANVERLARYLGIKDPSEYWRKAAVAAVTSTPTPLTTKEEDPKLPT